MNQSDLRERARQWLDENQALMSDLRDTFVALEALPGLLADFAASEMERLRDAATKLYMAGCWSTIDMTAEAQAKLWEDLRDALGLAKGTATKIGAAAPPVSAGETKEEK